MILTGRGERFLQWALALSAVAIVWLVHQPTDSPGFSLPCTTAHDVRSGSLERH